MPAMQDTTDKEMGLRTVVPPFYSLFFLCILLTASAASAKDVFNWGVVTPSGITPQTSSAQPLRVAHERPVTVFFSFKVKKDVTKVRFAISKSDRDAGVSILEETVQVKDNIAASRLLLNLHGGVPLGRQDLNIQAFDAIKNVEILTGKIPYILLPGDTECLCKRLPVENKSKNKTQGGSEHA